MTGKYTYDITMRDGSQYPPGFTAQSDLEPTLFIDQVMKTEGLFWIKEAGVGVNPKMISHISVREELNIRLMTDRSRDE